MPRIAVLSILLAVLLVVLGRPDIAAAQTTPTDPSKAWIYCWGYHVSEGQRYNCVSSVERQPIMESFLPAEGTSCSARIRGFSLERTGLQLDCGVEDLNPSAWFKAGEGSDYFTKPASAVRVRITSSFSGRSENFIVRCEGPSGSQKGIVNELVGSAWDNSGTAGVYRMLTYDESCTKVEVTANGVEWTFRHLDAATAYSPPRYWSHVTGVGMELSPEALQHLAIAAETERSVR